MALNATVGASDANSYVTLTEAMDYFEDRTFSTVWVDFVEKASALIHASLTLDWYMNWTGARSTSTQSMDWPRTGMTLNGFEVADDIIPNDVKTAVFELAISSLEEDRTADNPLAGIEQVKAGSLMLKAAIGDPDTGKKNIIPEKVLKILSGTYVKSDISIVRLMRA